MKNVWKVWFKHQQIKNTPVESTGLFVDGENFNEVIEKVKKSFPEAEILSVSLEISKLL